MASFCVLVQELDEEGGLVVKQTAYQDVPASAVEVLQIFLQRATESKETESENG